MGVSDHSMVEAWRQVFTLSRLEKGQFVTILTDSDSNRQTLATATAAAHSLGATVSRLELTPVNAEKSLSRDKTAYVGTTPLAGNRTAIAALKASDMIIDLILLLHSPEQNDVLLEGGKILLAVEPPEVLVRMVPTLGDRTRVLAAADKLQKAKHMRVTSAAGTDLHLDIGDYPLLKEYGFVDEPGRWDHWPSGFLATWGNELSASGKIVLDRGDILLPQKCYIQAPIEMTVESGYIRSIDGELDAELLNDYMDSFNDKEAYAVSHVGWGLQDRARWSVMGLYGREASIAMDARAFSGNFLFSMGPNTEAGGLRNTPCHMDIPMRNCTIELDGVAVVREGRVVEG
ncbi:MAG: 2,5-dihydroxypyridine 5,6-dioxygenase [Gammaproteobacteria bacterium]|nr:2,5-dihydroxypyridine 5,6-dioxygenase [Gammaproteobacteria bacterium]